MISNYLATALRNAWKYPGYTLINVLGLSVGLAAVVLIGLFVQHETSFDQTHPHAGDVYQIFREDRNRTGIVRTQEGVSGALALGIRGTVPEVESVVRVGYHDIWAKVGNESFRETLAVTEPGFFDYFSFPLVEGSLEGLAGPGDILITESAARRVFGRENVLDEDVKIEGRYFAGDYVVRGVLRNIPPRSTFHFDFLLHDSNTMSDVMMRWTQWFKEGYSDVEAYLRPVRGASLDAITEKCLAIRRSGLIEEGGDFSAEKQYHLQPFYRKYLYSTTDHGIIPNPISGLGLQYGNIRYVVMSSIMAAFILLIACVNFTNLATARSMSRVREIGLRKVVGAFRHQVISQFLGEALLISMLSLGVGLLLEWRLLPTFNQLVDRDLALDLSIPSCLVLLATAIVTGAIAGFYPAVVLSGLRPVAVLRGPDYATGRGARFRKLLVVFQFTVSIGLIISTIVVDHQLTFIRLKDLGFDRDQVIVMPVFLHARDIAEYGNNGILLKQRTREVKNTFLAHPDILKVGISRFYLQEFLARYDVRPEGTSEPIGMPNLSVDDGFFDTLGIPFAAGRPISVHHFTNNWELRQAGGEEYVINVAAAERFGWTPEEAIGKGMGWPNRRRTPGTIVGVVENFHTNTLHETVEPVVFDWDEWNAKLVLARVRGGRIPEALEHLEAAWKRWLPERPFTYEFLDDRLDTLYKTEQRQGDVFRTFSVIAIFVACLGLFGLASFTAVQRTREIGIRKVIGATESNLALMLSGEFTRLVIVANGIGWPVAWWFMNDWLEGFAYRIDLGLTPFGLSGVVSLAIATLTVVFQAIRAARRDPVDTLRSE